MERDPGDSMIDEGSSSSRCQPTPIAAALRGRELGPWTVLTRDFPAPPFPESVISHVTDDPSPSTQLVKCKTLTDRDFGIRIGELPDGVFFLSPSAARGGHPTKIAGIQYRHGGSAIVDARWDPEMSLEESLTQGVRENLTSPMIEMLEEEPVQEITHGGFPALQQDVVLGLGDLRITKKFCAIRRGDVILRIDAGGKEVDLPGERLPELMALIELLPGEFRGRRPHAASSHLSGVGWRLGEPGVFEAPLAELEVRPEAPWRFLEPRHRRSTSPFDDVRLISYELGGLCTMRFHRGPGRRVHWGPEMGNPVLRQTVTLYEKHLSTTVELFEDEDGEKLYGRSSFDVGETTVRFEINFKKGALADTDHAITTALRSLAPLRPSADVREGKRRLSEVDTPSHGWSHSYAGDAFVDWRVGLRVRRPQGRWRVSAGQRALDLGASARFFARELDSSLFAYFEAYPESGASLEEERIASLIERRDLSSADAEANAATTIQAAGLDGLLTRLEPDGPSGGLSLIASFLTGKHYLEFEVEAEREEEARLEATFQAWLDGFEVTASPRPLVEISVDTFTDHQFGVSVLSPGPDCRGSSLTVSRNRERSLGRGFEWSDGRTILEVRVAAFEFPMDEFEQAHELLGKSLEEFDEDLLVGSREFQGRPREAWSGKVEGDERLILLLPFRGRSVSILAEVPGGEDPLALIERCVKVTE